MARTVLINLAHPAWHPRAGDGCLLGWRCGRSARRHRGHVVDQRGGQARDAWPCRGGRLRRLSAAVAVSRAVRRGGGELSSSAPSAFNARKLTESALAANARLVGATPTFERIGETTPIFFSYSRRRRSPEPVRGSAATRGRAPTGGESTVAIGDRWWEVQMRLTVSVVAIAIVIGAVTAALADAPSDRVHAECRGRPSSSTSRPAAPAVHARPLAFSHLRSCSRRPACTRPNYEPASTLHLVNATARRSGAMQSGQHRWWWRRSGDQAVAPITGGA